MMAYKELNSICCDFIYSTISELLRNDYFLAWQQTSDSLSVTNHKTETFFRVVSRTFIGEVE
jgi:hypothetical protein